MRKNRRFALAVLAALVAAPGIAAAVTTNAPQTLTMLAAMRPSNGMGVPYSGTLHLKITPDGIIQGTYRSDSIRPDPTSGKIITVTGGLSGNQIHLSFGMSGGLRVQGTLANGEIFGQAFGKRNTIYDFAAVVKQ